MTNIKTTKRALLSSVMALFICFAMLLGTTFAWFTDSVTSAGNIIQSGTLDVEMEWKDATANGAQKTYKDASQGAIFNYDKWEPGYIEAKNIKISNVGTLALKYHLNIAANGEVSELAKVIDVYFAEGEYTLSGREMTELTKVGTLQDILDGMPANMAGDLEAGKSDTVTIALMMQEDAGNEYQGLSIGTNFSVVLMATQDNVEKDVFDENYDDIEIPEMHIETIDGVTYGVGVDGNYYMISVDDYTLTTFTVNENVTVLGTGNGEYDNDRVFGKNAPLTSLTLPEGLTEIKDNALNALPNLTTVNIPSTVKTIGIQAFRITGMSEVTLPENVEIVKKGAFRDMENLTTVTVEGNVDFDEYAFRSCPNLTSIYLLGDDVTFTGEQFATHSDNGDATGITIYVKNATVAARVYDAQASAYGYEVKILGDAADGSDATEVAQANNATQLDAAIANGASTILLGSGDYTFPASNIKAGTTIICDEGTVFEGKTGLDINGATVVGATFTNDNDYLVNSTTINGTFKDCVFTNSDGLRYCYAGESVVFENCVFDTDFYGVHFDGGANDVIFKNCTFTGFNTFGSAVTKLTMENCTFKYNGKGGYNGLNLWGNTDLINCTFVFDGSASYEWVDLRGDNQTVTFTNCVVTDGTTETPIEKVVGNYGTGNTIIVDGAHLATNTEMLQTAIKNGATNIVLTAGTYQLPKNNDWYVRTDLADNTKIVGYEDGVKITPVSNGSTGAWEQGRIKGNNFTFENVTFTNTVSPDGYGNFVNCVFEGDNGLRHGYYQNGDTTYTNCTFNNADGWAFHTEYIYGVKVAFEGCTFTGLVEFTDTITETIDDVYFNNCTFAGSNKLASGKIFYAWKNNAVLTGCNGYVADQFAGCTVNP